FDQSGLFLEASLASGAAPTPATDLKAALVSFRDAVSSWLATSGEGPAPEVPAQLITTRGAPSLMPLQTIAADVPAAATIPSSQPAVVQNGTIVTPAAAEVLVAMETLPA